MICSTLSSYGTQLFCDGRLPCGSPGCNRGRSAASMTDVAALLLEAGDDQVDERARTRPAAAWRAPGSASPQTVGAAWTAAAGPGAWAAGGAAGRAPGGGRWRRPGATRTTAASARRREELETSAFVAEQAGRDGPRGGMPRGRQAMILLDFRRSPVWPRLAVRSARAAARRGRRYASRRPSCAWPAGR